MNTPGHGWIRIVVGVLGALAAAGLFTPSARADCGDYVVIGNPQHAMPMSHAEPMQSEQPAKAPTPCTGLRCSGGVPVSPMQPVSPPPERGDEHALPAGLAPRTEVLNAAYIPENPPLRAVGPRTNVYHPPR